eukprot:3746369-Rhodomonas_salina.2
MAIGGARDPHPQVLLVGSPCSDMAQGPAWPGSCSFPSTIITLPSPCLSRTHCRVAMCSHPPPKFVSLRLSLIHISEPTRPRLI